MNFMKYILLFIKGMCMGGADAVPGVSGGTIAFIFNIYDELLASIDKATSRETLKYLITFRIKDFLGAINFKFFIPLGAGIIISFATAASIIKKLYVSDKDYVYAFFFGLVLASIICVFKKVKNWKNPVNISSLIAGTLIAFVIVTLTPAQTPTSWWFIMLSGALAICAMILPGISGSFILLILCKYEFIVIDSFNGFKDGILSGNFSAVIEHGTPLVFFGIGIILGLASFVKLLDWILIKAHDITVSFLIGFIIGSLWKLWPWKIVKEHYINSKGVKLPLVEANIMPESFTDSRVLVAMGLVLAGFILIIAMIKISERLEKNQGQSA